MGAALLDEHQPPNVECSSDHRPPSRSQPLVELRCPHRSLIRVQPRRFSTREMGDSLTLIPATHSRNSRRCEKGKPVVRGQYLLYLL